MGNGLTERFPQLVDQMEKEGKGKLVDQVFGIDEEIGERMFATFFLGGTLLELWLCIYCFSFVPLKLLPALMFGCIVSLLLLKVLYLDPWCRRLNEQINTALNSDNRAAWLFQEWFDNMRYLRPSLWKRKRRFIEKKFSGLASQILPPE